MSISLSNLINAPTRICQETDCRTISCCPDPIFTNAAQQRMQEISILIDCSDHNLKVVVRKSPERHLSLSDVLDSINLWMMFRFVIYVCQMFYTK